MPRRHAHHQGKVGHVLLHHGAGSHKGVAPDGGAANDGAVGAQRGALPDEGAAVFVLAGYGRTRVVDVGKDHARAAENVVFERHGVVDADVVLDLDVVADDDIVADEDVLPQRAAFANAGARADVDPVPDAGVCADLRAFVDDGGFVGVVAHGSVLERQSDAAAIARRQVQADEQF